MGVSDTPFCRMLGCVAMVKSCDYVQGHSLRDAAGYNVANVVPRPHPQKGGRGSGDI